MCVCRFALRACVLLLSRLDAVLPEDEHEPFYIKLTTKRGKATSWEIHYHNADLSVPLELKHRNTTLNGFEIFNHRIVPLRATKDLVGGKPCFTLSAASGVIIGLLIDSKSTQRQSVFRCGASRLWRT